MRKALQTERITTFMDALEDEELDVNERGVFENTVLHTASTFCEGWFYKRALEELLKHDDIDINAQDMNGDTPFHLIVFRNHTSALHLFLGRAELNRQNYIGDTPLHVAIKKHHFDIMDSIIQVIDSSFLSIRNKDGFTTEELARECRVHTRFHEPVLHRRETVKEQTKVTGLDIEPGILGIIGEYAF